MKLSKGTEISKFLRSLKYLIARKGRLEIFLDNAKTFMTTASGLKQAQKHEWVHHYLSTKNIKWQFNLSHAPW